MKEGKVFGNRRGRDKRAYRALARRGADTMVRTQENGIVQHYLTDLYDHAIYYELCGPRRISYAFNPIDVSILSR